MKKISSLIIAPILLLFLPLGVLAQTINFQAPELIPQVSLSISPISGSFEVDSTFEVPILIDTKGHSINSVSVEINFNPDVLSIVGPAGDTSIIGVWAEPPVYDNTRGTAKYVGVIPQGIITSSGLISSVTFKSKRSGRASITINEKSKVLLNDGLGTEARVNSGRANYAIIPKASVGVEVFSETHPITGDWYNNNNPILAWVKEDGVTGFSYELNNKPGTVPDNTVDTEDTTIQFQELDDAVWYFHIKSQKNGIWGEPSTFAVKIDTTPPAYFEPTIDYLLASVSLVERSLVSFFTTDNLSGIDHYEVGIIDKSQPTTVSPVFVETESPFQVPIKEDASLHVIVRAFDRAGNIREAGIDVITPFFITNFIEDNSISIMLLVLITVFVGLILNYFWHHHVLYHLKKAWHVLREEDVPEGRPQIPQLDLRDQSKNPEVSYPPTDHTPTSKSHPPHEL